MAPHVHVYLDSLDCRRYRILSVHLNFVIAYPLTNYIPVRHGAHEITAKEPSFVSLDVALFATQYFFFKGFCSFLFSG